MLLYVRIKYVFVCTQAPGGGGGGGGGTRIVSYIRRFGSFFGGFKILNFNIFGGFQKNRYFGGYKDFVDIFGVITKLDYI